MPELAEVAYYAKQWSPMVGQLIERVDLNAWSRIFRDVDVRQLLLQLPGRVMTSWRTHGKQMLFGFDGGVWLGIHLGMTGRLCECLWSEDAHAHFVLYTSSRCWVFSDPRQFGRVRFDKSKALPSWWLKLPPEVMSDAFTLERMSLFLTKHSKAPVKSVLLMQECFPGVGNWMADEVCWRSRIAPKRLSGTLSREELDILYRELRWVCDQALATIGVNYSDPPESWLFCHRWKDGGICPKSGVPLVREDIGGRTTCWSPGWQG